jgi:MoaA/NifB/PqqE/SkfB family radical SAM enzyme
MACKIKESSDIKVLVSPEYNYVFNKKNGNMMSWGKTPDDDPDVCPYGPVIADIEVSTVCHGIGTPCSFCYKSNTPKGDNMSLETFKKVFDMLPRTLTQIAFGIGDVDGNPELFDMFRYCNDHGVKPNVTMNGARMTPGLYDRFVEQCGAIATSYYDDDVCFDNIAELSKRGLRQCNIHAMLCNETYQSCVELINKAKTDPRLSGLNAIVFLLMKPKGDRNKFTSLRDKKLYGILIDHAMDKGVNIGFDSCGASAFVDWAKLRKRDELVKLAEPCESTRQSIYISCDGRAMPCSFFDRPDKPGIELLEVTDFVKEVWDSKLFEDFRERIHASTDCNGCAHCPIYDLDME